uniref:Peptidase M10 metallopeptidase domain-containing protein n=1 Tax=Panagrolaimus davidi TaxID=227884 RepID=A0A914Q4V5_9BILA
MIDMEYDLLWVALHEIGHVLGLDHTRMPMSVMAQFYVKSLDRMGYYIEPRLSTADIEDIQEIYGERALGR